MDECVKIKREYIKKMIYLLGRTQNGKLEIKVSYGTISQMALEA